MPGTTRYSATFDRPYEEEDEDLPAVPPLTRRSRSASWQATTANGRPYTPLGINRHARSSSTDNGPQTSSSSTSPAHSTERIPTRTTGKVSVKTSHNPFQFVKVGTCSLYKKAEEQLKKTQKVKQPEALKEEEEEWQSNLDSWKSRRRKMSQDVFRRQEEMKELLEMEDQQPTVGQQKKVKTFSEMVKDGASRGRTASLCLFSNPFGLDNWSNTDGAKDDSEMSCNDTHQSSESAESSNVNSEDEADVFQNTQVAERNGLKNVNNTQRTRRTGAVHFLGNHNGVNNGISPSTEEDGGSNCDFKMSHVELNGETLSHKCEPCQSGAYNDSGLDSLSSSHRAGDIADSGSDFSQDSGSSLDCDSPSITGIPTSGTELLEEFSSKDVHPSGVSSHKEKIDGMELCLKLTLTDGTSQQYGFTINGGKDKGSPVTVASVINGSVSDVVGLQTGDHILAINKEDISSLSHSAVISSLKQSAESRQLELLLWRPVSSDVKHEKPVLNGSTATVTTNESLSKRSLTEQTCSKEISNKTKSKATKEPNVAESPVDSRGDIAGSQSNCRKATPVKQKDVNCKVPAPAKTPTQESSISTQEAKKSSAEAASVAESQHCRTVESENEMFVDDFHAAPVSSNSKIPVSERSPKIMGKKMSKVSQEAKKNKSFTNDSVKTDEISRKAKGNASEESKDEGSLNIIYQSQSSVSKADSDAKELISVNSEHPVLVSVDKKVINESSKSPAQTSTNKQEPKFNEKLTFEANEVLPVDKVAEQMERLILEQLEEEERRKEKSEPLQGNAVIMVANVLPEQELSSIDTPPRQVEPPKEKPPPPPSPTDTNKDSPLHRVNSTKRIKKEIQKRRSDFLGIEKSEEVENIIPPPPDLENILKLQCEQERKVREMLGTESLHQRESSFEEEEIARKEREIIENLETEERMRIEKDTMKDESVNSPSNDASFAQVEVERIRKLQEERVRMEEERFLKEEQRIHLEEERHLREREEQIRREEGNTVADVSSVTSSTSVLNFNSENTASVSSISSSVSNETSLSQTGDGKNKETVCMPSASGDQSCTESKESTNNLVPTRPLKKKEVIRKERERLRQEQEALQREREEYRRQILKEQELLKESQKPHAPDAPVSRVGAPPPLKPALPIPLTSLPHASQALKENVIYTSRSPPTNVGNAAVGSHNAVVTSQNPPLLSPSHNAAPRPKAAQNDTWGPHKVPVVKKQPDGSSESRYNQNHWLIQEAEMRRISEQKERQRVHPSGDPRCAPSSFGQGHYHPAHVTEENYCTNVPSTLHKPPMIPGVPSLLSKPPSYPVSTQIHSPEQQWNYGQPVHPTPQSRKFSISNILSSGTDKIQQQPTPFPRNVRVDPSMQAPSKPSRVIPMDRQEQMLSVSGRKRCSHCGEELGRGAAMIIESLQLYYHIQCFRCCVCQAQLGNGSCGTDVRVRNNKLHCHNCYSNDEAGLKFSQV